MHRFRLLGRIDLRDASGNEVGTVLAQPKRLALLAYLALTARTGPTRRDTLLALLWPELDQTRARKALNKAVHFVRHALGDAALVSRTTEDLSVDSSLVWCDAVALVDASDGGRIDEALELYGGELLPGFYTDASPAFEEWLDRERTRLRRLAADAARRLARDREHAREFTSAVIFARRAAELSGDDERAVREVLELLDRLGDRAGALDAYERFARRLATEFDAEPAAETKQLIAQIRGRQESQVDAIVSASRPTPAVPAVSLEPRAEPVPAGGRSTRRFASLRNVTVIAVSVVIAAVLIKKAAGGIGEPVRVDPNVVAVAPFDVFESSLTVWREGLPTVLSSQLDGAGPLRTIPMMQIVHRWTGKAERESATQLGLAMRAGVVVYGRLLSSGADSIRAFATVLEVGSGRTTDIERRDRADQIDRLSDSLAIDVLRQLGHGRPVTAVRGGGIPSAALPVLKAYLLGEQYYRHSQPDSALVYFERATSLDSTFALAWRRRMGALTMMRSEVDPEVRDFGLKAGALNHGLTTRDSLLVVADSLYQALTIQSGDPEFASHWIRLHETLESFTRRYPEDAEGWFLLGRARLYASLMGRPLEETLDAIDRAVELDSLFLPAMHGHASVEIALRLGQSERAIRLLRAMVSKQASPEENDGMRFTLRVLESQREGSRSLARWADTVGVRPALFTIWALQWWPDSAETAVQVARALMRRSSLPRLVGVSREAAPEWQWVSAYALLLRGHMRESWQLLQYPAWTGFFGGVPAESLAAAYQIRPAPGLPWWAARRDTVSLRRQWARFDSLSRSSSAQRLNRYQRDRADAYLTLARGDTSAAVGKFVWLIDSACVGCSWTHQSTDIYAAARLLEARGRGREALGWLEHHELTIPIPLYEIAMELVRGRVTEGLGQRETASAAYRRVAALWANADPELQPMVAEARAGLRRLTP
jgi:serine/threonine-protein kinase